MTLNYNDFNCNSTLFYGIFAAVAIPTNWRGLLGTFRIFTTIEISGKTRRLEAGTREALRKTFPRLFQPPRILDGLAAFAVTEAKK